MSGMAAAAACALCVVAAGVTLRISQRRQSIQVMQRVEEARGRAVGLHPKREFRSGSRIAIALAGFGSAIMSSGLVPARTRGELEQTLRSAGISVAGSLELFIGSKIALALVLPLAGFMLLRGTSMRPLLHVTAIAAAAAAGLLAPDMIIGSMRKSYLAAVDQGIPDGLDMMVICAEAGLAMEASLSRVSVELVHAHPKLASELAFTCKELTLIADPRIALANLGTRTGLASLKRLGATLLQSIKYGTPLSAALRTLATELRQEALTRFEERAARLPVLLTIPMIVFILPCVFLVVAGPIVVQVLKELKH